MDNEQTYCNTTTAEEVACSASNENAENPDPSSQFLKCKPKEKSIPLDCDNKTNKHRVLERTTNKYFSDSDCSSLNLNKCQKSDIFFDVVGGLNDNGACGSRDFIETYLNQDDLWVLRWNVQHPRSGDFIALCSIGK